MKLRVFNKCPFMTERAQWEEVCKHRYEPQSSPCDTNMLCEGMAGGNAEHQGQFWGKEPIISGAFETYTPRCSQGSREAQPLNAVDIIRGHDPSEIAGARDHGLSFWACHAKLRAPPLVMDARSGEAMRAFPGGRTTVLSWSGDVWWRLWDGLSAAYARHVGSSHRLYG